MQSPIQEPAIGQRTTESLRALAASAANKLKEAMAQVVSKDLPGDGDALSHLISVCGNLDQLDQVVRHSIGLHSRPIPLALIELHKRIDASVDAAMDLAGWAYDDSGPGFASSAARAWAEVQKLLAFVEPTSRTGVSSVRSLLTPARGKTGTSA
jgi:hypothetical protein